MLFDLRGRGRRRTVQAVYLLLAIILGGGLIFFGVGTGTNNGGLLNAVTNGGGTGAGLTNYQAKITAAQKQTARAPKNANGWDSLAQAEYTLATNADFNSTSSTYTDAGKTLITKAQAAWEQYLALSPASPDVDTARDMANALIATQDYKDAETAQQIVAVEGDQTYTQWYTLAALSYYAGHSDKGDLAAQKALQLAPKSQSVELKTQLATYKKNGPTVAAEQASGNTNLNSSVPSLPTG